MSRSPATSAMSSATTGGRREEGLGIQERDWAERGLGTGGSGLAAPPAVDGPSSPAGPAGAGLGPAAAAVPSPQSPDPSPRSPSGPGVSPVPPPPLTLPLRS